MHQSTREGRMRTMLHRCRRIFHFSLCILACNFLQTTSGVLDTTAHTHSRPLLTLAEAPHLGLRTRLRGGASLFSCCFGKGASGEYCDFPVVVHYKGKEGSGCSPAIVGSAQSLGEWEPENAVFLTHGPGDMRWSATIRFPKEEARFEFKYVLIPSTGSPTEVEWEKGHNREVRVTARGQVELGNDSTMPHHLRHPFNVAPPCVDITFLAHHAREHPSQTLSIVGSHKELGEWDPTQAIPLIPGSVDKQNRTQWRVSISLPFPLHVEYKFIRIDTKRDGVEVVWQTGGNRHCVINPDGQYSFLPDQFGVSFNGTEPEGERRQLSPMAEGRRGDPRLSAFPQRGRSTERGVGVRRLGSMERIQQALRAVVGVRAAEAPSEAALGAGSGGGRIRGRSPVRVPDPTR